MRASVGCGEMLSPRGGTPSQSQATHQLSTQACLFLYKIMFLFYTKNPHPAYHICAPALGSIPQEGLRGPTHRPAPPPALAGPARSSTLEKINKETQAESVPTSQDLCCVARQRALGGWAGPRVSVSQ